MATEWMTMNKRRKLRHTPPPRDMDDDGDDSTVTPLILPNFLKSSSASVKSHQNHIYFNDDINSQTAMALCHELRNVDLTMKLLSTTYNMPAQPIYLHLTTNGGEVHSAFLVVDTINQLSVPVYTVVEGFVASAGTLISLAGEKRFISENAYMLLHELRSGVWGKMSSIEEEMENLKKIMDHITSFYIKKTNLKKHALDKLLTKDVIWNSSECVSKGVVDDIYKVAK